MTDISTQKIFKITSDEEFNNLCLDIFRYQAANCAVYKLYLKGLRVEISTVDHYRKIPFLPIEFFKSHQIISGNKVPEVIFTSSGTTGMVQSKHPVTDADLYRQSYIRAFEFFYGSISEYALLALLPSYLERDGSSLIYMVDDLIQKSENPSSGYYLHNHRELFEKLNNLKKTGQKTLLIGVTYALLEFVEQFQTDFPDLTVMETGGMKGRRKEMIRQELHSVLREGFGVTSIHSEYGMTELLSQAYSKGEGTFFCPPWMKVLIRDTNDPLTLLEKGKTGGLNIIDLANINSCSFIATQDLGIINYDGSFTVAGRFDNSDIRGCNLLVQA